MELSDNPYRGHGLDTLPGDIPFPAHDPRPVRALLSRCPAALETPIARLDGFGGAGRVLVKDERGRMGLGSFKALGAAYVIAREAEAANPARPEGALAGRCYVTASAGNHGLSVAAGARVFGARAVVVLDRTVPEAFARRLAARGAEVHREGADYGEAMAAAARLAEAEGWTLLSDSSWPGYHDRPHLLMEGYLALAAECTAHLREPPSLVLLQAGVGGLAAACAAHFRAAWGEGPRIVVVEPAAAPALTHSIAEGRAVTSDGPASCMGRLDCKAPSLIALKGLARDADGFALITEDEARAVLSPLQAAGLGTTPSGGAGLAALMAGLPGVDGRSRVLTILSEGPER
ncbi:pyridoxal-phosphate dependent enzyme [Aquicoccus sp. SCR17]|nr:pyridoxal-phosphate dependent enzyme [Carideicomes alvinocaridis]